MTISSAAVKEAPHSCKAYFLVKCLALGIYYSSLQSRGLTMTFKLLTFNMLTPIGKFYLFNRLNTQRDCHLFAFSVANDFILSSLHYLVFYPWFTGTLHAAYVLVLVSLLIGSEMIQHRLFFPDTPYNIMLSTNPLDNSLPLVATGYFYFLGRMLDFDVPADSTSFPVFLVMVFSFDLIFGTLHYLSHCNSYLVQKHSLHHKYKKEQLNAFANYCCDIVDAVCMNFGLIVISAFLCRIGRHHLPMMDMVYALAHTHCRYNTNQMNLMYFFEFDLIDIFCGKERISCFHADHHRDSSRNFAVFGFFSDRVFRKLLSQHKPVNEKSGGRQKEL